MPKKSRKSTFSRKAPAAKRTAEWRQSQDPDELLANDAKRKEESRQVKCFFCKLSKMHITPQLDIIEAML